MIIVNFAHPLTETQHDQLAVVTGSAVERVVDLPAQFDNGRAFVPQVQELLAQVGLTPEQWQTEPVLVVPPALNYITAVLLAELHGRMGYFPAIVRLRPVEGSLPPRFEVAEMINLQAVRDDARMRRLT
jgi:hypothetical protein